MKKILLSLAVALVATGASAVKPVQKAKLHANLDQLKTNMEFVQLKPATAMRTAALKANNSLVRNITTDEEATGEVFKAFIHTYAGTEVTNYVSAITDTLLVADKVISFSYTDEEENEKTEEVKCNFVIKHFGYYNFDVYGAYVEDEQGTAIVIPKQEVLVSEGVDDDGTPYMYSYSIVGISRSADENYLNVYSQLLLEGDDQGDFTCETEGWGLLVTDLMTEKESIALAKWDFSLKQIDGRAIYNSTIDGGWRNIKDGEEPYTDNIAIDDYEVAVTAYGFVQGLLNAKIEMNINEDGTVSIPTGQPMYDKLFPAGYNPNNPTFDYGYMQLFAVKILDIDGNEIPEDDEETQGYLWPVPEISEIKGELRGNYIYIPDYFVVVSNLDEQLRGMGYYNFVDMGFVLNEGLFTAGIEDMTTTREYKIKNTKTYNLMGQQVNRSQSRGLLIRGGKKYIGK